MPDNFVAKEAITGTTFRSTDTAGVHTPHHIVDSSALPAGASTAANQASLNALLTVASPVGGQVASADTAENAFAAQAVKTPVTISLASGVTGTLTIRNSGGDVLAVLEWEDTNKHHNPTVVLNAANMNQLTYQFSVNAGTEIFRWHAGA